MPEAVVPGAAPAQIEPVVDPASPKPAEKPVVGISKEEFDAKIAEINKTWQSRFDTVVAEKKGVAEKAMTVEEQIKLVMAERKAERLEFAREKARLSAKIEDGLESAMKLYLSDNADEIARGAEAVQAYFTKREAAFEAEKQKAIEDALAKAGAQPRPKGGKDENPADLKAQYEAASKAGNGVEMLRLKALMQQGKK